MHRQGHWLIDNNTRVSTAKHGLRKLSQREAQLLLLCFNGKTNKEAALAMGLKLGSVYSLWTNIYFKLNCSTAAHAIAKAVSLKIIQVCSAAILLFFFCLPADETYTRIQRPAPRTMRSVRLNRKPGAP